MLTVSEFENETQGPSTSAAADVAQDDRGVVDSECLEHSNAEFQAMLRVLAEC
jgi:hypothetical protein